MGNKVCRKTSRVKRTQQFAKLTKKNKQAQNVYGSDIVIKYFPSNDKVVVTRFLATQMDGQISPEDLPRISRLKPDPLALHFLKNKNLQDAHHALRGALLVINNEVGWLHARLALTYYSRYSCQLMIESY
jgi:hypothetical protein